MSHTCPRYQPDRPRSCGINPLKILLTSYIYINNASFKFWGSRWRCRVMGTEMRPGWALNAMHK
ncbi:hypothetical protein BDZ94DRAFT_1256032 [Collybia nuda]|uniref:Uncharacterized protein n=1 Tax=Collybia nuda TaxID=64659 RepID=A0A9P5Y8C9_9AGAR|nr:hypothetical protein BDZ94DRAFT_1256032 [Collybia nuda]